MTVAEEAQELAGMDPAGHEHELGDVGLDQRLDRPVDHRRS